MVANRRTTKAIENAKKIRDKSISIGTNHALKILGECNKHNKHIKPVCNYPRERDAVIGKSDQTSQGNPPCSESTCASMPPKHKYIKLPSGRPPIAWSMITDDPMDNVSPSNDGVAPQSSGASAQSNQQTAYKNSDWTVFCHRPAACQHTRKSVLTVSCRRTAAGRRIKQEIKSHRVPTGKQTDVPTRRRHSHWSSSASSTKSEASPSQCQWTQNSSLI